MHLPPTQQTQHLALSWPWQKHICFVDSIEILIIFATDFICVPKTSLHTPSFLSLSSPSQQLHKNCKQEKAGNLLKEHKDLVLASQSNSTGTCPSRTCGFSVCMFLANSVYPGSTDGAYHLASLPVSFLQQR